MKKLLTVSFVLLLTAVCAQAAPLWSVDFENGFTASSGTAYIFNGDLNNPGDTTQEIHVEVDPADSGNMALDLEYINTTVPRSYLTYEGLPSTVSPTQSNTVSCRWYNAAPGEINRTVSLWNLSHGDHYNYSQDRINLYLARGTTDGWYSDIWAYHNYDGGEGYYTKQRVSLPIIGEGWHDISLSWDYLGYNATLERESADVELIIDGTSYFSGVMGWADFTPNMLSVGCRFRGEWSGTSQMTSAHQLDSLERGDLMDDFVITPEPATLAILGLGAVLLRKRK